MAARASVLAGVLLATTCQGDRKRPETGQSRDAAAPVSLAPETLARCVAQLERAAGLPPLDRAGVIVRGCALCGEPFDQLLAGDHAEEGGPFDAAAAWRVVEACGGVCSKAAAGALRTGLAELGRDYPTLRPWRTLAGACPQTMHAGDDEGRFASAAWYALATVNARLAAARPTLAPDLAARLDAAVAELVLPLPPRSATGNPLALPTGAAQPATPWLAVSIIGDQLHLGPLPFARLTGDGLRLHGQPRYPGTIVPVGELRAAVATAVAAGPGFTVAEPGRLDRPVILAPHGSEAGRVLDVVRALGDEPVFLAVKAAAPASLWPGQLAAHPVPMAARDPVRAPHLRVDLPGGRVAAVDAGGTVVALAPLPSPEQPMAARLYAVAAAMAPGGVVEVIAGGAPVADLAALLDAAVRGGAAGVVPAPPGPGKIATGAARDYDAAALRALVTPP